MLACDDFHKCVNIVTPSEQTMHGQFGHRCCDSRTAHDIEK